MMRCSLFYNLIINSLYPEAGENASTQQKNAEDREGSQEKEDAQRYIYLGTKKPPRSLEGLLRDLRGKKKWEKSAKKHCGVLTFDLRAC
jgi:hypothetical protein